MKKYLLPLLLAGVLTVLGCTNLKLSKSKRPTDEIDKKVANLLSQMTIEEKVGQMTQVTLEVVSSAQKDGTVVIDMTKLRDAIVNHHVGSILNCGGQAQTLENWHKIITTIQDVSTKETRLGIPNIYGIDAIHGVNYTIGATIFPQNIAMAATGNKELAYKSGEITAYETRASGIPWNFNPVLGLARQPLWPRVYETFGEDATMVSILGSQYIKGLQGDDISDPTKVTACMKHYLGYSVPQSGNDRTPALIPDRDLKELFVRPFQAAVDAGVATVMINSSEINGIPIHSSKYHLKTLLKDELGFDGFSVSDWNDINNLFQREMVAKDQREAVKMAVLAGVDMSMVPYDYSFYDHLVDLVKAGEVPESRIDEAVSDILRVKFRLGLFENPYPNKSLAKGFASAQSTKINCQAASEAITLLKNDKNILPLKKDTKVLVTGPTANKLSYLNGGWTITWQGENENLYPKDKQTILAAIKNEIGQDNVVYTEGVSFDKDINLQETLAAAMDVDVIIACVGEATYTETPGNITDITMSWQQMNLVKKLTETGKPVITVLVEGRPRVINYFANDVEAVVMAYLPGMEGGPAIADVLFGDVNPSGKLPITYPKYPSTFDTYDHKYSVEAQPNKFDPQWPFGFGLSYTTFQYSNLKVDTKELELGDNGISLKVSVDVKNTGKVAGKETVQLYLSDLVATVTPRVKSLRGFEKIALNPGESKTVTFELTCKDFAFVGRDMEWTIEPGEFKVAIANLNETITVK